VIRAFEKKYMTEKVQQTYVLVGDKVTVKELLRPVMRHYFSSTFQRTSVFLSQQISISQIFIHAVSIYLNQYFSKGRNKFNYQHFASNCVVLSRQSTKGA